jgi:hypothetical protein
MIKIRYNSIIIPALAMSRWWPTLDDSACNCSSPDASGGGCVRIMAAGDVLEFSKSAWAVKKLARSMYSSISLLLSLIGYSHILSGLPVVDRPIIGLGCRV